MNTDILDTASRFLQAAASYWGIPPDQLLMGKQGGSIAGVFEVQLTIALTPGDLVGITHRMHQMAEDTDMHEPRAEQAVFVPDDDLQLTQWRDDYSALSPQEKGKYKSFQRYKAHRMAEQFEADGLTGQWQNTVTHKVDDFGSTEVLLPGRPAVNTRNDVGACVFVAGPSEDDPLAEYASVHCAGMEGVGGRRVQHVDVAEEPEAVSELPAAVWVADADVSPAQRMAASDYSPAKRSHLVQVDMLTPEQLAKYCGEQKP